MKINLTLILILLTVGVYAQKVTDEYFTFCKFSSQGDADKAIASAQKVLPLADKLLPKTKILFYNRLAKIYETKNDADNAILYYEKVASLVPDYYVAHLALGYLYLKPANALAPKINGAKGNRPLYEKYMAEYKGFLKKSLPHLEKAYACDPNEQVMDLLRKFSKTLNLAAEDNAIKSRVEGLAKNCVTLLTED